MISRRTVLALLMICAVLPSAATGEEALPLPVVTTGEATVIGLPGAKLHGTVNANGLPTNVAFEYGLTSAYGTMFAATPGSLSGNTAQPVSLSLPNLLAGTTYHFRVRANNAAGTSVGADATFTTAVNQPPKGGTFFWKGLVLPGGQVTMSAFNWKDDQLPLTYQFFFNGVALGPRSGTAFVSFQAPIEVGTYPIRFRVFDALGAYTESDQSVVVNNKPIVRTATAGAVSGRVTEIPVAKLERYWSDPDGDTPIQLDYFVVATEKGGTSRVFLGVMYYTPPVGYTGPDTITYSVKDSAGSTATGKINVTVAPADSESLNVISIAQTAGGFLVRFAGIPGESYQIQYRDALTAPWQLLDPPGTIVAGANGIFEYEDKPNPKPASRFYRAIAP